MNEEDYRKFYDTVGARNGWDFSSVRCITEGNKPDLYGDAAQMCKRSDIWLDIGTGGGEAVIPLADRALLLIGIDMSEGMIASAQRNLALSGASNVRMIQMNAEKLAFPDRFFQLVTCRQSGFDPTEAARVLSEDGVFLTQQVSEADKSNLKQAFGRGQCFGVADGTLRDKYVAELKETGFTEIICREYEVTEYYRSAEDLIFLLKHTPIIPNFGQNRFDGVTEHSAHGEEDFRLLDRFIRDNQTAKGIRTNAKRFVIEARKQPTSLN